MYLDSIFHMQGNLKSFIYTIQTITIKQLIIQQKYFFKKQTKKQLIKNIKSQNNETVIKA